MVTTVYFLTAEDLELGVSDERDDMILSFWVSNTSLNMVSTSSTHYMHILWLSFSSHWIVFYSVFLLSICHLSDISVVSILAVVTRTAWMWLSRHLQTRKLSPLGMCQGVGQLDMKELCFCFSRILHTDFHKSCQFAILPTVKEGFLFPTSPLVFVFGCSIDLCHSDHAQGCFDLHFPNYQGWWTIFEISLGHPPSPCFSYFENFPVQVSGKFFFFPFWMGNEWVNVRVGQLKGQDVDLGCSWAVQSGLLGPSPPLGNGQSWLFYALVVWSQLFHEGQGQLCCFSDQWGAGPAIPEPVKSRTHSAEPWDFNTVAPMAPGDNKDHGHLRSYLLLCQSPCLLWVCLGDWLLS